MSAAFTEEECRNIRLLLLEAAQRHAASEGMRRTSVDSLAEEAGISKGAFYRFYPAKEYLFLDMLERRYQEIAARALAVCEDAGGAPAAERAAAMFRYALRQVAEEALMPFLRDDAPLLERRLPRDVLQDHFRTISEFIRDLLRRSGFRLLVEEDTAVNIIRILFMSLLHARDIGPGYPAALDALVTSACRQLIVP